MDARVKARAVIWVDGQIVVSKVNRRGALHITLPGGRVNERESVVDALKREVLEEIGIEIMVGDLMLAAEVISGARRQDVELVFTAEPVGPIGTPIDLIDPRNPGVAVLPPILDSIVAWHDGWLRYRWLGNLYTSQAVLASPAREGERSG